MHHLTAFSFSNIYVSYSVKADIGLFLLQFTYEALKKLVCKKIRLAYHDGILIIALLLNRLGPVHQIPYSFERKYGIFIISRRHIFAFV